MGFFSHHTTQGGLVGVCEPRSQPLLISSFVEWVKLDYRGAARRGLTIDFTY